MFPVVHNTISLVVHDVCKGNIEEYAEEIIACPTTPEELQVIIKQFGSRWNFHHTVGALYGKHVAITCPNNGGSLYLNYKGLHFIVLMALVDADYKFVWVDLGANGSTSDAAIFIHSEMKKVILSGTRGFPAAVPVPNDEGPMPYFIIGDDAFLMRTWLMKQFFRRNLPEQNGYSTTGYPEVRE